eukprot:COSAG05_NODE_1953_length_3792_cov_3.706201_1_plen_1236_part_10
MVTTLPWSAATLEEATKEEIIEFIQTKCRPEFAQKHQLAGKKQKDVDKYVKKVKLPVLKEAYTEALEDDSVLLIKPLTESEEARIRAMFDLTDADGSGELDQQEISSMLLKMGKTLSEEEQVEAMAIMDKDGSGDVDYAEFRAWYLDQNLGMIKWSDLSDDAMDAWAVLGWNEGSWAYQEPPPTTENMDWDELTDEQRVAATSLGYREQSWSDPWSDLTDANRSCWEALGWTEESWKGTAPAPATEQMDWKELTEEQREAADALGYTEKSWSDTWSELDNDARLHWETLGWTALSWGGKEPAPVTEEMGWGQLSDAQRQAASSLGFSKVVWEGMGGDFVPEYSLPWTAETVLQVPKEDLIQFFRNKCQPNFTRKHKLVGGKQKDVDKYVKKVKLPVLHKAYQEVLDDDSCLLERPLTASEEARIYELFFTTDADGSGELDQQEISSMLLKMGKTLSEEEQVEAMAIMDKDGSGDVDYAEFRAWYLDQNLGMIKWSDLSDDAMDAWAVLGWNEGSWAYQEPPPTTENMDWDELTDEQRVAATSLGYREQSWSDPWSDLTDANRSCWEALGWTEESWKGTAPAPATEQMDWKELTEDQRLGAEGLGFNEKGWAESWSDLADDIRQYWEILGWTEASWSGKEPVPATEGMNWSQLSEFEKQAAAGLGFSKESWEGWADDVPEYGLPWSAETIHLAAKEELVQFIQTKCVEHFVSRQKLAGKQKDVDKYVKKVKLEVLHKAYTEVLTTVVDGQYTLLLEQPLPFCEEARIFELFRATDVDGSGELNHEEVMAMLLKIGKTLSEEEQAQAMATMDKDGSGDVNYTEFRAWYLLNDMAKIAWEELSDDVREAWVVLGWTEASWGYEESPPATENMDWDELTEEQREAATSLGYREQSWSDPWPDLADEVKSHWEVLGWTEESWKGMASAPVTEQMDWNELTEQQRKAAELLGYNEHSWKESWEDLDEGARVHWETLGWTAFSWSGKLPAPLSEQMDFEKLSDIEREAAIALGFTKDLWEGKEEVDGPSWTLPWTLATLDQASKLELIAFIQGNCRPEFVRKHNLSGRNKKENAKVAKYIKKVSLSVLQMAYEDVVYNPANLIAWKPSDELFDADSQMQLNPLAAATFEVEDGNYDADDMLADLDDLDLLGDLADPEPETELEPEPEPEPEIDPRTVVIVKQLKFQKLDACVYISNLPIVRKHGLSPQDCLHIVDALARAPHLWQPEEDEVEETDADRQRKMF